MVTYTNDDGLTVFYGARTVDTNVLRKVNTGAMVQEVVLSITGADLNDTETTVNSYSVAVPSGAYIESATLIVDVLFVGATATMDIGTYKSDGAAIDDDGIDVAIAVGALTADAVIACNGAQVGAVINNTAPTGSTDDGVHVRATWDTAAFTAGSARLVVKYIPNFDAS